MGPVVPRSRQPPAIQPVILTFWWGWLLESVTSMVALVVVKVWVVLVVCL